MPEQDIVEQDINISETFGSMLRMLIRARWWILCSLFLVTLPAIGFILRLPNRYSSDAILVVVRPQVPRQYAEPLNTISVSDEVESIKMEVLSRARLIEIIDAFGLYPKLRQKETPAALAEIMRKDVSIDPIGLTTRSELTAFKVSFSVGDARLAQEVTSRLTSLFIEVDLKKQEGEVAATTSFVGEQLAAAKKRLDQQEQRLRDFKVSNLGTLPEQQQTNMAAMTDLRIQLQNVAGTLNRVQQQKSYLESYLNGHIARLQSERTNLLRGYTAQHPEVVKKDQVIARAKGMLNRLKTGSIDPEKSMNSAALDDPVLAQLEGQIEANLAEIANAPREEQRLRGEIAQYQGRINLTPVREQQLASIMRDYELYKKDYTELLDKQLRSQQSASLEEKRQGQHYRLIDPPTLPTVPSSPNRLKLSLGAFAGGLAVGFGLAFLMSLFDRSYNSEKQVRTHLGAPLVVGIPVFFTPAEERKHKRTLVFEWLAGSVMMLAVAAAEFYVLRHG